MSKQPSAPLLGNIRKSSGPPPLKPSFKVKGDVHNQRSGLVVAPVSRPRARGPLKVPAQSRWNNPWDASLVVGSRRPRWSVARHGTRRNRPLDPGGAVLRARGCAVADTPAQINFDAPAVLRKWPSVNNERLTNTWPYLAAEGTLDDCTREFMSKPVSQRHLYEIHTAPQGELITAVLSAEQIIELARLRDFL